MKLKYAQAKQQHQQRDEKKKLSSLNVTFMIMWLDACCRYYELPLQFFNTTTADAAAAAAADASVIVIVAVAAAIIFTVSLLMPITKAQVVNISHWNILSLLPISQYIIVSCLHVIVSSAHMHASIKPHQQQKKECSKRTIVVGIVGS